MTQDKLMEDDAQWRALLDHDAATISRILLLVHRVAVIGIKPPGIGGPAYEVPAFMQRAGYDVVPVPIYYPDVAELLGVAVHRSLETVQPPIDMVLLFRRPADVPRHLTEILAATPRVVWMQLGIRHDATAEALARAGMAVIQNRCIRTELLARSRDHAGEGAQP